MDADIERQRLLAAIAACNSTLADVSRRIGRNHAYLHQYVHRGSPRRLPDTVRRRIATLLSLDARSLLPGPATHEVHEINGDSYALIPVLETRAAAGPGGIGDDTVIMRISFRMQWLRRVTDAPLDRLAVIEVDSDSMEPTLRAGDHVLVDLSQTAPVGRDGIYVLRRDGVLQIKRLSASYGNGHLTVSSDNPHYPPETDIAPNQVDILGRVIWLGRRI